MYSSNEFCCELKRKYKKCGFLLIKHKAFGQFLAIALICYLRWLTTVTSKQNAHIKFKSLTSNSNHSQQIQITHSKFKSLTANSNCSQQITNPPEQITNHSHQIQIVHIKYKLLTANTNMVSVKRGLRTADCELRTRGKSRLRVKCKLQTKCKIQNGDRRLGVKCRMKSADCRPGGK